MEEESKTSRPNRLKSFGAIGAGLALLAGIAIPAGAFAIESDETENDDVATVEEVTEDCSDQLTDAEDETRDDCADQDEVAEVSPTDLPSVLSTEDENEEETPEVGTTEDETVEELDETSTETFQPLQTADEGPAPEIWLDTTSINQFQMEDLGVTIYGHNFPSDSSAVISINGQEVTTTDLAANGTLNVNIKALMDPGVYDLTVTVGEFSDTVELTIQEGGYTIELCVGGGNLNCFSGNPGVISDWDVARKGFILNSSGFSPGSQVTVTVNGETLAEETADDDGQVNNTYTTELPVGEYTIGVSSVHGSASYELHVGSADEQWSDYDETPSVVASHYVVTESQIAETPIEFEVRDFPYEQPVDVYINGAFEETVTNSNHFDYEIMGNYRVGEIVVEFRHPIGSVTETISVVPDEHGEPPYEGTWLGHLQQIMAASYAWADIDDDIFDDAEEDVDPNHLYPMTLDIDENGTISGVSGEYWWVCIGPFGYVGSGYSDIADSGFPATQVTIDQPFEIMWTGGATDYRLRGTIGSDGVASGVLDAGLGACGMNRSIWELDLDGDIPTPEPTPTPDPEPTETPTPTPDPEPTTEPSEEPTPDPEPSEEPTPDPTPTQEPSEDPSPEPSEEPTSDPEPTETPTPTPDPEPTTEPSEEPTPDPEPSEEPTEEPSTEPSEEPTSDPEPTTEPSEEPTPDPEPTTEPSEEPTEEPAPGATPDPDELTDENAGSISVPAQAQAGESITISVENVEAGTEVDVWLFSDPVHLGTEVVSAEGTVAVTIPADTSTGEHKVAVYTADGLVGWDVITIVADDEGTDDATDEPTPAPTSTDDEGDAGETADKDSADGQPAGKTGGSGQNGSGLAATGPAGTIALLATSMLLIAGGGLLMRRRRTATEN